MIPLANSIRPAGSGAWTTEPTKGTGTPFFVQSPELLPQFDRQKPVFKVTVILCPDSTPSGGLLMLKNVMKMLPALPAVLSFGSICTTHAVNGLSAAVPGLQVTSCFVLNG